MHLYTLLIEYLKICRYLKIIRYKYSECWLVITDFGFVYNFNFKVCHRNNGSIFNDLINTVVCR